MRESIVYDTFKIAYGRHPHLTKNIYYHSDGEARFTSKKPAKLFEKSGFIKAFHDREYRRQSINRELLESNKA